MTIELRLAFFLDELLVNLGYLCEEKAVSLRMSSLGLSQVRTAKEVHPCKSPSRFALGHLIDTMAGEGTADRLCHEAGKKQGWSRIEKHLLADKYLSTFAATENGHFTVSIQLVAKPEVAHARERTLGLSASVDAMAA